MKQIKINNLLWDEENLAEGGYEYEGNHYFTFDEAQEAAKKQGKRCPTPKEFAALKNNGYEWDDEKKGMWFAKEQGGKPKEGIFFPAAGYRYYNSGNAYAVGSQGLFWSAVPYDGTNSWYLGFDASTILPQNYNYRSFGFPVRLVQDIEQPDPEEPTEPMGEPQTTADDRERPQTTDKSSAVYATSAVSAVRENRNEDAPRQKTEAEEVIERLIDELGEVKKFMGALRERGERLGSRMWDRDFNDKVGIWQSSRLNSQYNYMRGAYEFLTDYSNTLCERITDLKDKRDNG